VRGPAAVPQISAPETPPVAAAPPERGSEPKSLPETSSEPPEWRAVLDAVRAGDTERIGLALRELSAQPKPATIDRQEARRLNDQWLGLGRGGRMAGPLPLLERAHEADPADPEIAGNLADALMRRGNLPKALGLAIDSVRLNPRRSASWGLLGFLYAKLDRPADAAGCLAVGHHFATNKLQTIRVYTRLAETDPDPRVQAAMKQALTRIGEPR
jgi:tetratricopeptide (TPR) repeat protein